MAASGTVMRLMLQIALPLILWIEHFGLRVHDFVLVGAHFRFLQGFNPDYVVLRHNGSPVHPHTEAGICSSIFAISSSTAGTLPPPRPQNSTARLPSRARRTSSTIWPLLSSTTRISCARSAVANSSFEGNGHKLIGRNNPTFLPCFRASSTAERSTRDTMP